MNTWKKRCAELFLAAVLSMIMVSTAFAGQWIKDGKGWWYQRDNGTYPVSEWMQDTDGIWYYFGGDGYMLADTTTPDGFKVDSSGAWVTEATGRKTSEDTEDTGGYAARTRAQYSHINYGERAKTYRVFQSGNIDCAIASMASIEAYYNQKTEGIYGAIHKAVDGPSNNMDWTKAGYQRIGDPELDHIYNNLKNGPVIIRRDRTNGQGGHFSVIVAYQGNENQLVKDGFKVMEVKPGPGIGYPKNWGDAVYVPLGTWERYDESKLSSLVIRNGGLSQEALNSDSQENQKIDVKFTDLQAAGITETDAKVSTRFDKGRNAVVNRCGAYLGTSKDAMKKSVYDEPNQSFSSTYVNTGFGLNAYGVTLEPGTTYYYQFFAVVDGTEYKSAVQSFTTVETVQETKQENITFAEEKASEITENNAKISAKFFKDKSAVVDRCGAYIGTSKGNLDEAVYDEPGESYSSTYVNTSFGLNKYGVTLQPDTKYYYQFFAVVNGTEYTSDVRSFTTKEEVQETEESKITFAEEKASEITKTNAKISAKFFKEKNAVVDRCGAYIGTSKGSLDEEVYDEPGDSFSSAYVNTSFGLNKYGLTLQPETTYYYQFFAVVDGNEYQSTVKSFKTER